MTPETTNEERNAAERIVRAMVADMDRLLAENAALRQPDQKGEADKCRDCGFPRKEHSFNGACYGLCGEFVAAPPPAPEAGGIRTGFVAFRAFQWASTGRVDNIEELWTIADKTAWICVENAMSDPVAQPAPEAGKLPSEEAVRDLFFQAVHVELGLECHRPDIREAARHLAKTAKATALALLSPAQPHDVPAGEDGDGAVER